LHKSEHGYYESTMPGSEKRQSVVLDEEKHAGSGPCGVMKEREVWIRSAEVGRTFAHLCVKGISDEGTLFHCHRQVHTTVNATVEMISTGSSEWWSKV
jgi:deoxycytidylate deaminase